MNEAATATNQILDGIGKIAWPILAAFVVWRLYPILSEVMKTRPFTVKVGEMEVSVQEASNTLGKQIGDLQNKVTALEAPTAAPLATRSSSVTPHTILWVDDKPQNNAFEIARLREHVKVETAVSTDDAMSKLSSLPQLSAIITDMERSEDGKFNERAGLDLLGRLCKNGITVPVYFYSSSRVMDRFSPEIRDAGADITTSPIELLKRFRLP
jgi:hypothetical protein